MHELIPAGKKMQAGSESSSLPPKSFASEEKATTRTGVHKSGASGSTPGAAAWPGGGGVLLTCEDFGRMFNNSFPAYAFLKWSLCQD